MRSILQALEIHARLHPEQAAVEGAGIRLSYRQLHQEVEAMAGRLAGSPHRILGLLADNGPAWLVMDLAAARAGVALVPLPGFFSAGQLAHVIRDAGIRAVYTDHEQRLAGMAVQRRQALQICGSRWQQVDLATPAAAALPPATVKLTYTSGTTGTPKGVCLGAESLAMVAESLRACTAIAAADRHLCLLPLATLLENVAGVYVPLLAGACICVPPLAEVGMEGAAGLDVERLLVAFHRYRASRAILLPHMLQLLVEALRQGASPPSTLRFLAVGGAPLAASLLGEAEHLGLPVYEGYGLSECASVVAVNHPAACRAGSVGRPLPHVRLDFAGDGEILVSGACFLGYLGDTGRGDGSGPLHTGDLGYLDAQGYLHITGRKKHIFITSLGRNVAPEWVERELVLHAAIRQAAVFGEGCPWCVAVVVRARDCDDRQVAAAIAAANRTLPDYARIGGWVAAVEPFLPANGQLTATGRLRRSVIREIYEPALSLLYGNGREPSYKEDQA